MSNITIKDIARMCGVGVSTVSRALNNHPDINPETREKIMQVIRDTGFVPNNSARYLKQSESNSIALIVKGITNPFFTGMIQVIEDDAEGRGYTTILRHVESLEDEVGVAQALVKERKLKGIVFLGGNFTHDDSALEQIGVPFVFATIGEDPKEVAARRNGEKSGKAAGANYANVAVDDVQASYDAVNYLIGLGHRKIGMIAEGVDIPSVGRLRVKGYRKAMEEHGLPVEDDFIYEVTKGVERYTFSNGYEAAEELLRLHPDMTAIFCISDVMAIGACRAIIDSGRRIPEDVSVIGFDGIEMGDYVNPRLTTVQQPFAEISNACISMLFGMIEGKQEPEDQIMDAHLCVRESTGPGGPAVAGAKKPEKPEERETEAGKKTQKRKAS